MELIIIHLTATSKSHLTNIKLKTNNQKDNYIFNTPGASSIWIHTDLEPYNLQNTSIDILAAKASSCAFPYQLAVASSGLLDTDNGIHLACLQPCPEKEPSCGQRPSLALEGMIDAHIAAFHTLEPCLQEHRH
mmetsp:Transcript_10266/g.17601  ORF Transcript_10266/g.17601 Transcript_10266/m.17601 type:complete len:133 (-) Transcript_10266:3407-3805(-)